MPRPSSTLVATDGNMGLVPASPGQAQIKLGVCTSGPLNTLVFPSSKAQLVATFGSGPTVEAAALAMDYPGRGQVGVCRCAASTAGAAGSVTKTDPVGAVGVPTVIGSLNARVTYASNQQGVTIARVVSGNLTALSVTVTSKAIAVNSATDNGGAATTTAAQELAAVLASSAAMALLSSAALTSGSDGSATIGAVGATALPFGGSGAVTVAGAALDAWQVRVLITRSGTVNVGAFRYSLDGGDLYSAEITIPLAGTYEIPGTGLTLTFTPGAGAITFAKDELYSFDCTAPAPSNGDLQTALAALQADPRSFGFVHVVGSISTTIYASLTASADAFEAANRFVLIVAEVAPPAANQSNTAWLTALRSTWDPFGHKRIGLCGGDVEVVSTVSAPQAGRTMKRNSAWTLTARAGSRPISEDLGRVLSGPLLGVTRSYQDDVADGLIDARFSCCYSLPDYTGFFGAGLVFSPTGSDFRDWQDIRVLNEAMRLGYLQQTTYLSETVRPRLVTQGPYPAGAIDPGSALAIEDKINATLRDNMVATSPQLAAAAVATVDRTNVLTTGARELKVNYQVTTLITLKKITGTAGLRNVALALQQ